jgi:hypothetical protein
MKALILNGLFCLTTLYSWGQTTRKTPMTHQVQLKEKIALACKLTDRDQIRRMNELHQTLFKKVDKRIEHTNSYELIFQHPDDNLSMELAEFIKFERLCCPWLLFHLTFQPGEGPVSLKMGNSGETKEMVKLVMQLNKSDATR